MKKYIILMLFSCSLYGQSKNFLMKIENGTPVACESDKTMITRAGGTSINIPVGGYTISASGKYFIGDLSGAFVAGVTPITITASDVELDLNGFTITGPGTSTGAGDDGIFVNGATNVVIKNGTLEQIDGIGLRINNSTSILLEDILCRANAVDGFNITVTGNRHCSINDCRAEGNSGEGFFDAGGSTIGYKNCTAFNNGADGFDLTANNHLMEECTSNENTGLGLSSTGTAMDVISCHFDENIAGGLSMSFINDVCIQDCTFNRNGNTGLAFNTASDMAITRCCIIGNDGDGINVGGTSDAISIFENSIINNADKGITLDASTTQSCQIIANRVMSNGTAQASGDAYGIDIGGMQLLAGGAGATARTHEVFSNFAKNNGFNPADLKSLGNDTNYSNDVQLSPNLVALNGLVTNPVSSAGTLQNIST